MHNSDFALRRDGLQGFCFYHTHNQNCAFQINSVNSHHLYASCIIYNLWYKIYSDEEKY